MSLHCHTIENSCLKVSVISYGAAISSIIDKSVNREMVLGFDELEKYKSSDKYIGATIGRVANRIALGRFTLENETYQLAVNNGPNHLHGGLHGFDKKEFDCYVTENRICCTCTSPYGEEGYPGNMSVEVNYTLHNNRLIIETICQSDETTLSNLTNHTYFNLDNEKKSILDHRLKIISDQVYPIDEFGCTYNQPFNNKLTPFDFTSDRRIGECLQSTHPQILLARGLDHHFDITSEGLRLAAILSNRDTRLLIYTDKPGMHVYTANYLDGTDIGADGQPYHQHSGICFETQYVPNSINFDQRIAPILRAGQIQKHQTVFEFQRIEV